MTSEQGRQSPPRTDYTFWPNESEKAIIEAASSQDVVAFIERQPDMAFQFLHELWRTHRGEDMYEVVGALDPEEIAERLVDEKGIVVVSMMRAMFGEPEPKCALFLETHL